MKHWQWLLIKIAEESAELSQIALKTDQFGLFEVKPGQDDSNLHRIFMEYNDLLAHMDLLNDYLTKANHMYIYPDLTSQLVKQEKANRYLHYSISLGCVEGEKSEEI